MANFSGKVSSTDSLRVATGKSSITVDSLKITPTVNASPDNVLTITNARMGQATTLTIPDVGAATGVLVVQPSESIALAPSAIVRVITITAEQLSNFGFIIVQPATSETCQFQIVDIKVLGIGGLQFGNRFIALSDGHHDFNDFGISPEALMGQQMVFWGTPNNPGPPANGTSVSVPGSDVFLSGSGGDIEYSAGSQTFMITLAQIAS